MGNQKLRFHHRTISEWPTKNLEDLKRINDIINLCGGDIADTFEGIMNDKSDPEPDPLGATKSGDNVVREETGVCLAEN